MTTATKEKKDNIAGRGKAGGQNQIAPAVKIQVSPKVAAARQVVDAVAAQARKYIENGELIMPKDFDVNGALKASWLALQDVKDKDGRPALEVCTQNSIANSLLNLIIQGLNPLKKQCAFVVFGTTLALMREYFGSMAIAERLNPNIKDWGHQVVYEDDELDYDIVNGRWTEIRHKQKKENIDKEKIIGAYAMPLDKDNNPIAIEYMTIDQIHEAWKQSPSKPFDDKGDLKPTSAHARFTADFARKTVINKVAKFIINRSSDNKLLLDSINRNQDITDAAEAQAEIDENANKGDILEIEAEITEGKPEEISTEDSASNCPDGGASSEERCKGCESRETCIASVVKEKAVEPGKTETKEGDKTKGGRKPLF